REIDADDLVSLLGEEHGVAPFAAAEVEHTGPVARELGRLPRQLRRPRTPDEAVGSFDVLSPPRAPGRPLGGGETLSAVSACDRPFRAHPCRATPGGFADRWRGLLPPPGSPPSSGASTDRRCRETARCPNTTRSRSARRPGLRESCRSAPYPPRTPSGCG